jgi:CubicO group peptidase (beta-lactamase class C family)
MPISRRNTLVGLGATAMSSSIASAFEWQPIAAKDAGLAEDLGARIDAAQRDGGLNGLHGVVLVRHGRLALERYYVGKDERLGRPLGEVSFGAGTLHDLRSVTKSIVGLLYGIALEAGKVPQPEAVLVDQFPEYPDLAADPHRRRLTVAHALSMTLGIEWREDGDYTNPANGEIAMERSPDRWRYVLERPIVEAPGGRWVYCGGASALIGRLLTRGTGMRLPDYARNVLYGPLGIGETGWSTGGDGEPLAASGARLTPRDLARIGQLVLQRGQWEGRQVAPAAWIDASTLPRVTIDGPFRYGWHWYLGEAQVAGKPQSWIGAIGNGGQRLLVAPGLSLVVAITAGNYNSPIQSQMPGKLFREIVLPGVLVG